MQNGKSVCSETDHYYLKKYPFDIVWLDKTTRPSQFASADSRVAAQIYGSTTIASYSGTGVALGKKTLYLDKLPFDFYQGWSSRFEKDWPIFSKGKKDFFQQLQSQFDKKLLLSMSGRNYHFSQEDAHDILQVEFVYDVFYNKDIPINNLVPDTIYVVLFSQTSNEAFFIITPYLAILHFEKGQSPLKN